MHIFQFTIIQPGMEDGHFQLTPITHVFAPDVSCSVFCYMIIQGISMSKLYY